MALGLVLLAGSGTASADALPPEDGSLDCPDGSEAAVCHGGNYCRLDTCETDADCDGRACEAQDLCLGTIDCAGDDPTPTNTPNARECSGSCCETVRVCSTGCGCQLVGGESPGGWAALVLVAAVFLRRRD